MKRTADQYQALATDANEILEVFLLCDAIFRKGRLTSDQQSEVRPNTSSSPQILLQEGALPPLTTKETAQLACAFCFIWFIANWTVNASLELTSVASATILSSMSGMCVP